MIKLNLFKPFTYLVILWMHLSLAQAKDAQDWLVQSDNFRLPALNNQVEIRLTSMKGDKISKEALYTVWTRGSSKSIVEMHEANVRGQRVLMRGDALWLFIPTTRRAIRITPMQRLMGETSYGDIARMVWREDYTAEFDPQGEDLILNNRAALKLNLTAKDQKSVYSKIDLIVAKDDGQPLTADFFLASGKLIKTAHYGEVLEVHEGRRAIITQIIFEDAINKQQKTIMDILKVISSDLSESYFTKAGFKRR